jgi:hypothetical protein
MILLLRTDRTQAYLVKDMLTMHGISAHIFNEHISSIVGEVPPDVALPQVWLDDDADKPRAMQLLRDYHMRRNRRGVLFCPACREENPATFEICWACGTSLEAGAVR